MAELKPRKEVRWFAQQMEKKLRANEEKRHWSACSVAYLRDRLNEELRELEASLIEGRADEQVIGEAADVANFAMMIADNVKRGDRG